MFDPSAINIPFSTENIHKYANTIPLNVAHIEDMDLGDWRVNHYMIKNNNDSNFVTIENKDLTNFIKLAIAEAKRLQLDIDERYWYLTVDQGIVSNNHLTLREPGWHIDGMQGQEVPIKKNGDFQFIWSNTLMTEFCKQEFSVHGLDPNTMNVFSFLSKQILDDHSVYSFTNGSVILMHCYHVHRCQELKTNFPVFRKFVRLSFTNTPITSTKLTINNNINYNYPIHMTTGDIPKLVQ
jgi:hypothetical protein